MPIKTPACEGYFMGHCDRGDYCGRLDIYGNPFQCSDGCWDYPCASCGKGTDRPDSCSKISYGQPGGIRKIAGLVKKNGRVLADLVLTRYEGSMYVAIAVVRGKNIFAYAPKQKTEPEKIREYLKVSVRPREARRLRRSIQIFKNIMSL